MDQKPGSVNGPADRQPAMLRAEIAQTRAKMGATIEALHGRLNPTVLKEQALDSFHDAKETVIDELKQNFAHAKELMKDELQEAKASVKAELLEAKDAVKQQLSEELASAKVKVSEEIETAKATVRRATIGKVEHMVHDAGDKLRTTSRSVLDTIKSNPIPATLIGAGIAWLFISTRQQRSRRFDIGAEEAARRGLALAESGYEDDASNAEAGIRDKVAAAASDAGATISNAAHTTADAVSRAAHQATASVGAFAHRAGAKASDLGAATKKQAIRLKDGTSSAYHANPMAVGAAVLAVGTALGLAIPSTRREDAFMGRKRDALFEKAGSLAQDALESVEDAATQLATAEKTKASDAQRVEAKRDEPSAAPGAKPTEGMNGGASRDPFPRNI